MNLRRLLAILNTAAEWIFGITFIAACVIGLIVILLAACSSAGGGNGAAVTVSIPVGGGSANYSNVSRWTAGPIIGGVNYSSNGLGMPINLQASGTGFKFDVPRAPGEIDYLTYLQNSDISRAGAITLVYEITGDGRFVTSGNPNGTPAIALYFQRAGDNWSAQGEYNFYRWYSKERQTLEVGGGVKTFSVPLDVDYWKPVLAANPGVDLQAYFDAAKRNVSNVGFTFGGGGGAGHGVYIVDGNAVFNVISFTVE